MKNKNINLSWVTFFNTAFSDGADFAADPLYPKNGGICCRQTKMVSAKHQLPFSTESEIGFSSFHCFQCLISFFALSSILIELFFSFFTQEELATTGEKDWYFYCPRNRKYRNSARPNRVTGAGFWKATGTDRPIYSAEGINCIGLKKSLVFYTGRAAKGIKTDWMMHEFRLPALTNSATPKRFGDKNLPANDAWAICRIFKKTNSMAQIALSHSWVSPLPKTTGSQILNHGINCTQFSSENISCITETGSTNKFCSNNDLQQCSTTSFSPINIPPYKAVNHSTVPTLNGDLPESFMLSSLDMSGHGKCTVDVASMLLNSPPPALLGDDGKGSEDIDIGNSQQDYGSFSFTLPQEMQGNMALGEEETWLRKNMNTVQINDQWGSFRSLEFPFAMPPTLPDTWRSNLPWDSLPCPSDISTSYSTNKCYT